MVLSILALPSPYLMKLIFDRVLVSRSVKSLNLIIILLLGIQLIRVIFSILADYHFSFFSQEIMAEVKKDLFYRILRFPFSFFDKNQTGYLLSRIGEVEGLNVFFSSVSTRILLSFFEFVFCLTILFFLNWKLTIISLTLLPGYYFIAKIYARGIRRIARETYESGASVMRQIQDSLSGVDIIKYFGAEKRESEKINTRLDEFKKVSIKRNIAFNISSEMLSILGAFGGLVILWYSGLDIIKGSFTIGSYIAFSAYVGRLYGPTQMLANIGIVFQPAAVALDRIGELMDLAGEDQGDKGIKIESTIKNIEFKHVFFSYDNRNVLSDINIKFKKGDKVLLAGPNGSGKSTLVRIILGLYKAQKGSVLIDGHDISELCLSSLRDRICVVSQTTFLFNDTIKNNILYGRPESNENEVEEVAKLSGAYRFIRALERGFETEVGERGMRLSGGEKQKISIARAILRESDIIIFDEVTAHLDKESEKKIDMLIQDKFMDKMCIIISHRIRDLPYINRICLLDRGKIVEDRNVEGNNREDV